MDLSANIVFDAFLIVVYYCTSIWFAFAAVTGGIIYIYVRGMVLGGRVQLDGVCGFCSVTQPRIPQPRAEK